MALSVADAAYPSPQEIRDLILADLFFGAALAGVEINILPGSDNFIRTEAYANACAIAIANNRRALAALLPTTATGQDLTDLAAVYGVFPRAASKSSGYVVIGSSGSVAIPMSYQGTAPSGLKYQTVTADFVANGEKVLLESLRAGLATQLSPGIQIQWDSAAVGSLKKIATVDVGGITGGRDADDPETLRRRLLNRLAFPGVGGNPAMVIDLAEKASAGVEYAFVYSAVRGPGSYDVALTSASADRSVPILLQSQVAGSITAELPGHASLNLTTVTAQYIDLIFQISVPTSASGGGFRDLVPWPTEITKVTAIFPVGSAAPTIITVNSVAAPVVGQAIGIWDWSASVMREFTVTNAQGIAGAWLLTTQGGFTGVTSSPASYVSVGAFSLTLYAAEALAQIKALGPGEKTDSPFILPRAKRIPAPEVLAPPNVGPRLRAAVQNKFPELELEYAARWAAGTTTSLLEPGLPPTTLDPPKILALKQLAFIAPAP